MLSCAAAAKKERKDSRGASLVRGEVRVASDMPEWPWEKKQRERESEREESESERARESEGREPDVRLLAFSALFSTIDHRDERQKRLSPVPFPSPIFSSLSSAVRLQNLMLLPKLKEEEDRELKSQGTVSFFLFLYGREREEREERASLLFSSSLVFLFY